MPEQSFKHLSCALDQGVLVLALQETSIQDEKIAEEILQDFIQAMGHFGLKKVVIDFQKLKYMSSVAFRPLLNLRRKIQDSGGRLIICNLSKLVGDVFYTTRLVGSGGSFSAPFELESDVPAAIARANSEPPAAEEK
jgi:anti-anti-sigma factor